MCCGSARCCWARTSAKGSLLKLSRAARTHERLGKIDVNTYPLLVCSYVVVFAVAVMGVKTDGYASNLDISAPPTPISGQCVRVSEGATGRGGCYVALSTAGSNLWKLNGVSTYPWSEFRVVNEQNGSSTRTAGT